MSLKAAQNHLIHVRVPDPEDLCQDLLGCLKSQPLQRRAIAHPQSGLSISAEETGGARGAPACLHLHCQATSLPLPSRAGQRAGGRGHRRPPLDRSAGDERPRSVPWRASPHPALPILIPVVTVRKSTWGPEPMFRDLCDLMRGMRFSRIPATQTILLGKSNIRIWREIYSISYYRYLEISVVASPCFLHLQPSKD